jgi:hypothetical protein
MKASGERIFCLPPGRHFGLLIAVLCPLLAAAQFVKNKTPQPVELEIKVFIDNMSKSAPVGITVQVLDNFGSLELEGHTDSSGSVRFNALSGDHSIRVFGRDIEESTTTMEIEPVEMRKMETVVVRSKKEPGGNASAAGTISVVRLSIPAKAQQEFERGSNALGHKDWPEAKKRFEAAIAIFPNYDLAYNGLGDAALASGDNTAARTAFEKAISLNKDFAEPYRNLAKVSFAEHKFDEADTLLTQSLVIDPANARALTYAANAELITHKYSEAIEHARKVHTLPHDGLAGAHIIAARALEATQQPAEAVKEYRLYLAEEPAGRDVPIARDAIARINPN